MKLAVLSISGGLDSTCLLLALLHEGYKVKAYWFDYGQKHAVEKEGLLKNIEFLKSKGFDIELQLINLRDCFSESQSSLCDAGKDVPQEGEYSEENMHSTVVENRNVIFASIIYGKALSLAKKYGTEAEIFLGVHKGDGIEYPDCTEESRSACADAFAISNYDSDKISYEAPFVDITKAEVLEQGLVAMYSMGFKLSEAYAILKNTRSCYAPDETGKACGKCATCIQRLEAFAANDMTDPIEYQEGI